MRPTYARLARMASCVAVVGCAAHQAPPPETEHDEILYAIGVQLAMQIRNFHLEESEVARVEQGLRDAVLGRPLEVDPAQYIAKMASLQNDRMAERARREKEASRAFLERAEQEEGAIVTASGLVYTEIEPGDGESPTRNSVVRVHYHGTLRTGEVFDSSRVRGKPAKFPLSRVIPCWAEALQRLRVGGKAHLVCPSEIAYGDRGYPPRVAPGAALAFEVELIEIVESPSQ